MYHVSSISGLKELKPAVSRHATAYVYATDNLVVAILFGAKRDDFAYGRG